MTSETGKPRTDQLATKLPNRDSLEQARVEAVARQSQARADAPAMELTLKGDVLEVSFKHSDPAVARILMMADIGTCDLHFMAGVQNQVAAIGAQGKKFDAVSSNFLLSVVRGVKPRDELEAMLAIQMAAIHQATMMMARRLNHVDTIPQQDAAERALNKLARTYSMQMETLKRYRSKGQQVVRVERVTVHDGGQAIVGAVRHGGRGGDGKK